MSDSRWPADTSLVVSTKEHGPRIQVHDLKCWPPHWAHINSNRKRVDIRRADRTYRVGDLLILREWDPEAPLVAAYTGRVCTRVITHILQGGQFGLTDGYVALSLGGESAEDFIDWRIEEGHRPDGVREPELDELTRED